MSRELQRKESVSRVPRSDSEEGEVLRLTVLARPMEGCNAPTLPLKHAPHPFLTKSSATAPDPPPSTSSSTNLRNSSMSADWASLVGAEVDN